MARQPRTPQGVPKRKAARKRAAAPKAAKKSAPQKRQRDYAAEYARRTAGVPKGQRGAARGHRPPPGKTEAQVRRETIDRLLTDEYIRRHYFGSDPDGALIELRGLARREGMAKIRANMAALERLRRRYNRQKAERVGQTSRYRRPALGIDMDELSERLNLPPEFLGYH